MEMDPGESWSPRGTVPLRPPISVPVEADSARPSPAIDDKARMRAAVLSGPILPTLFKLATPTLAVMLAQTAVNTAEAYYVGFLGTDALAGAALVFPIFMLMMMMSGGGLGNGVASAVARATGAGRQDDVDAIVLHTLVLAVIFGAVFTIGTILGGRALYASLGGTNSALDAALTYSNTLFAGSIAVWIVNLLAAAMRGSGNVKVPAAVTLVGALVMIPASPAFIFGFGPIPRLGIAGAGVAFGLYYVGAVVVLLRYILSGRSGLKLKFAPLQWRLFADILRVGLPSAVITVITNLTVILVTGAAGLFGTHALAAYGIASRLDYIMVPVLFGVSSAVLTMVGVCAGAGNVPRARTIAIRSGLVGFAITETVGLVVAVAPMLWIGLFSHDADVVPFASTYLRIVAPAYGLFGMAFVVGFAAQGAGHVLWPFIGVVARLFVAAGLGWLAVTHFGAGIAGLSVVIVLSFVVYASAAGMVLIARGPWKMIKP
jgi:putative MATE family efflux protein